MHTRRTTPLTPCAAGSFVLSLTTHRRPHTQALDLTQCHLLRTTPLTRCAAGSRWRWATWRCRRPPTRCTRLGERGAATRGLPRGQTPPHPSCCYYSNSLVGLAFEAAAPLFYSSSLNIESVLQTHTIHSQAQGHVLHPLLGRGRQPALHGRRPAGSRARRLLALCVAVSRPLQRPWAARCIELQW